MARLRNAKKKFAKTIAIIRNSTGSNQCPICSHHVKAFLPHGLTPRDNARCPICGSLERHRLDWLFIQSHTNLFDAGQKKILHIAPERFITPLLKRAPDAEYLSGDIIHGKAMFQMDITDIQLPDKTISTIYCSHVLEHVPKDLLAISEFFRILKPGGWAILNVPIRTSHTYENDLINTPSERLKEFGHPEHVRNCGLDYADRIQSQGFDVETVTALQILKSVDQCNKHGVEPDRTLFYCTKQSA